MSGKKYKGPLPKSKPNKLERLLNKRVKGEKGPYKPKIGDLNEMGPIVTDTKTGEIVSGFEGGGNVISDDDAKRLRKTLPYVPGKTISDADAKRLRKNLPYVPPKISDADLNELKKLMKPLKFEDGGAVRGMGRAYQGKKRGCKIR
jgi:hypothetical protein